MPRRNLDAEWAAEHPRTPPSERIIDWEGVPLIRLQEMPISAFDEIENPDPNATRKEIQPIVDAVKACLEPECHEAYETRVAEKGVVSLERLMQLWRVLVEESVVRPTQPPADSSGGQSQNGTPSTGGASTTEEWTSGALVPGA